MASDTSNVPAMSIDFKQNRIRVHKKTLRLLGSPDYVQLLVNPADGGIALRRLEQPEPQHFKVNWDGLLKRNSFDIHSMSFIRKLRQCSADLPQDKTYRIKGKYIADFEVARFCLKDAEPVNTDSEDENEQT